MAQIACLHTLISLVLISLNLHGILNNKPPIEEFY